MSKLHYNDLESGNYLDSKESKQQYWLDTKEVKELQHYVEADHFFGMGRPTYYYKKGDLELKAIEKYGVEELARKRAGRGKKRAHDAERFQEFVAIEREVIASHKEDLVDIEDVESLAAFVKGLTAVQLQRYLVLIAKELDAKGKATFFEAAGGVQVAALSSDSEFKSLQPQVFNMLKKDKEKLLQSSGKKQATKKARRAEASDSDLW